MCVGDWPQELSSPWRRMFPVRMVWVNTIRDVRCSPTTAPFGSRPTASRPPTGTHTTHPRPTYTHAHGEGAALSPQHQETARLKKQPSWLAIQPVSRISELLALVLEGRLG